jgi:N6-L-threonylcarbamoyladenine synthase
MLVLGIETSCDETSAAVVEDGVKILSNVVSSQVPLHLQYGGVVPEIACRAHLQTLPFAIDSALKEAECALGDIGAVAVTTAPGLIGALMFGLTTAKTLSWLLDAPLVSVNHVEAHIYAVRLGHVEVTYPVVSLVVSGGHTSLYLSRDDCHHALLGATTDDAAGEAFDKVASLIGLPYPGGPAIDAAARKGDRHKIHFPRTLLSEGSLDFSFSGLKTAVLYHCCGQDMRDVERRRHLSEGEVADIAASFQEAVVDVLVEKTLLAVRRERVAGVAVGGGVACNSRLRERLREACAEAGMPLYLPEPKLCTDNGAVVAGLGYQKLVRSEVADLFVEGAATLS